MKICVEHPLERDISICGKFVIEGVEIHPLGAQATCIECKTAITRILNAYRRKAKRK